MENIDNTQNEENECDENYEFEFNFVNMPWDDRSKESKIGIILLLVTILLCTTAGVINSFCLHYQGFESVSSYDLINNSTNCQITKMDQYPFATRIHSMETKELICVGALVGDYAVLANGACVRSGPIRIDLGNVNEPRCKNGFSADEVQPIYHDGVISNNLVLLSSQERLTVCGKVIPVGLEIDWDKRADVIGRTFNGRSVSRQPVSLAGKDCVCPGRMRNANETPSIICVKRTLPNCPILVGNLLVQRGHLLGLASATSSHQSADDQVYCFADLNVITKDLQELGIPP